VRSRARSRDKARSRGRSKEMSSGKPTRSRSRSRSRGRDHKEKDKDSRGKDSRQSSGGNRNSDSKKGSHGSGGVGKVLNMSSDEEGSEDDHKKIGINNNITLGECAENRTKFYSKTKKAAIIMKCVEKFDPVTLASSSALKVDMLLFILTGCPPHTHMCHFAAKNRVHLKEMLADFSKKRIAKAVFNLEEIQEDLSNVETIARKLGWEGSSWPKKKSKEGEGPQQRKEGISLTIIPNFYFYLVLTSL
jgi:hypothetical protein